MEDPGPTSLTAHIDDILMDGIMVDLGATVNILPLHIMERLGLALSRHSHFSLFTFDYRMIKPIGVIDQVLMEVGTTCLYIQFMVIDLEQRLIFPMLLD